MKHTRYVSHPGIAIVMKVSFEMLPVSGLLYANVRSVFMTGICHSISTWQNTKLSLGYYYIVRVKCSFISRAAKT